MDKALVFGTKDCRFESCQGHVNPCHSTSYANRHIYMEAPLKHSGILAGRPTVERLVTPRLQNTKVMCGDKRREKRPDLGNFPENDACGIHAARASGT